MSEDYFGEIEPIFLKAVKLSGERRQAYIDRACAGRAALREEVESLLDADESSLGVVLDVLAGLGARPGMELASRSETQLPGELQTCRSGHQFDRALYTLCPQCGIADLDLDPAGYGFATEAGPLADLASHLVAGWLVCVEGPDRGRDYVLRGGTNVIGRSGRMAVCLANDPAVSNEAHAVLTYEQRSCVFLLGPGSAGSITYLNGALVAVPTLLRAHDAVRVGGSVLHFVPFCGALFQWRPEAGC